MVDDCYTAADLGDKSSSVTAANRLIMEFLAGVYLNPMTESTIGEAHLVPIRLSLPFRFPIPQLRLDGRKPFVCRWQGVAICTTVMANSLDARKCLAGRGRLCLCGAAHRLAVHIMPDQE
jgi:hypothetical protein